MTDKRQTAYAGDMPTIYGPDGRPLHWQPSDPGRLRTITIRESPPRWMKVLTIAMLIGIGIVTVASVLVR